MSFPVHPWKVVERGWQAETHRFAESLMSLANGYMGLRGNFEEDYSGETFQGTYLGGVWFPDKTRVGWWKKGYPAYYGKVVNIVNLIGVHVVIDQHPLDLSRATVWEYEREVDMRIAVLYRHACVDMDKGSLTLDTWRFVSLDTKELLCIRYQVTPSFDCHMEVSPYLDGNVRNEDANYGQTFWNMVDGEGWDEKGCVLVQTKPNPYGVERFTVAAAMASRVDGLDYIDTAAKAGYSASLYAGEVKTGTTVRLEKFVAVYTSRDHVKDTLMDLAMKAAEEARESGWEACLKAHSAAWQNRWSMADVQIEGDDSAQQGIRFNLFHLMSTYTGNDARLNIGPKGFTGERFGGATYWDTEAYCLPVFLAIGGADAARQLLLYRYHHLDAARQNAQNLGMPGALYPVSTITGNECHNEWEVAFEGIHRNAAIVHAIYEYTMYTGDETYLLHEGVEVMAEVARFWAGRVHLNQRTQKYMIHGVTGPNEYENNVNNNWYTNRMAAWCLEYFTDTCEKLDEERLEELHVTQEEIQHMRDIAQHMYYPDDRGLGIFPQHDAFLDKDLHPVSEIPPQERPLYLHWSWDRILRSGYIKQPDVMMGLYFLNYLYDTDTIRRNFDFYAPLTLHESGLSPCIHSILAAQIGEKDLAVAMYKSTARYDLDNINQDTRDGLHITSMSGSWLALAKGFAGMRTLGGLRFAPFLPECWNGYGYKFNYRERVVEVRVKPKGVTLTLLSGDALDVEIYGRTYLLEDALTVPLER